MTAAKDVAPPASERLHDIGNGGNRVTTKRGPLREGVAIYEMQMGAHQACGVEHNAVLVRVVGKNVANGSGELAVGSQQVEASDGADGG